MGAARRTRGVPAARRVRHHLRRGGGGRRPDARRHVAEGRSCFPPSPPNSGYPVTLGGRAPATDTAAPPTPRSSRKPHRPPRSAARHRHPTNKSGLSPPERSGPRTAAHPPWTTGQALVLVAGALPATCGGAVPGSPA